MKNVIVYTVDSKENSWKRALSIENVIPYINLQIENSLRIGWNKDDIKIITNFDHEYMGIKCINNEEIFKGFIGSCMAKYLGVKYILESYKDSVYLKDHDCYEIEKFEYESILGQYDFVCAGKLHKRKISDQSSFFSINMIPIIENFYEKYKNRDKRNGFMFVFGRYVIDNHTNINIVNNKDFPYRFNMCGNWRKTLKTLKETPKVLHQKLNIPDVFSFLKSFDYCNEFLILYEKYSKNISIEESIIPPIQKCSLTKIEFEILQKIINNNNIKSVLEFGPGTSTVFFKNMKCNIDSYEYVQKYMDYYKKIYNIDSTIFYDVPGLNIITDKMYDLSLVDSPKGTKHLSRYNTLHYAISSSKIVIIHDCHRSGEKESIQKIMNDNPDIKCHIYNTEKGLCLLYNKKDNITL